MQYTFKQAKERLSLRVTGLAADKDIGSMINDAVQALSGLKGWERLRRVYRFSTVGPCFTLPQGSAGLVRVCVNGKPTTVRGQDFRFIQSGPGDLRRPPHGFCHVKPENVLDGGVEPVIVRPVRPFRVFAYCDGDNPTGLSIRGVDHTGREVVIDDLPYIDKSVAAVDVSPDKLSDEVFSFITAVVVPDDAETYITLYAEDVDTDERFPISMYHPKVTVPVFHRYMIPGVRPGQPVDLLTEVRIDPLPLVRDTDVIPFESLEPIEWMIRSDWCAQSAEPGQADQYQSRAEKWLMARELTDNTFQTNVVINNAFTNSLGEASMDFYNI